MWKEFVSSCIKWWTNRNDDSQNRQWIQPLSDCDRWRFRLGTTRGCGCDIANRGRCTALVGRTTGQYVGLVLQFSTRSGWKIITNSGRYRGFQDKERLTSSTPCFIFLFRTCICLAGINLLHPKPSRYGVEADVSYRAHARYFGRENRVLHQVEMVDRTMLPLVISVIPKDPNNGSSRPQAHVSTGES